MVVPHPSPERRRYFLSSFEPSGEFDAVIVAVTHDGRRRYFTTRDGASMTEVDEVSFERRRESGTRSMLELDERELGELEVELEFVRPVRGRDPIAEADAEGLRPKSRGEGGATQASADAAADAAEVEETEADPPPARRATYVFDRRHERGGRAKEDETERWIPPMTEEFEAIEEVDDGHVRGPSMPRHPC